MSKKKVTTLALAAVLAGVALVGGTMAYFMDTDSATNVMTVGNVSIEQREWQRGGEDGNTIVAFVENKKLAPVTGDTFSGYDSSITVDGYTVAAFSNDINVVDKIVNVKNTGTEEAYVRTVYAFEMLEDADGNLIDPVNTTLMTVVNAGLDNQGILWPKDGDGQYITINVNNTNYIVGVYYYRNESKLAADEISHPSLEQIYLTKNVGNEFYEQLGDDHKYDILVLSQAVQTQGFADAKTALDTAFGEVNAVKATEWFAAVNA